MEVNLVGDSAETLRALIPLLEKKTDRSWRKKTRKGNPGMVENIGGAGDEQRGIFIWCSGDDGTRVPYAVAAKFAFPDRVAIALVGDGAMLMNGVNELVTIAHYWREWSDPRLIVMVLANQDLN
jgi:pyruvate dehydrogenase (quinone)